ncbi:MAG: hypothetical protein QE484_17245 [Rhizobium sp.]|nr:hypothetical protein [Rhizobium sp.]
MTVIIDGKAAAASVIETVTSAATTLESSAHRKPGLAVIGSQLFVQLTMSVRRL